tara:strand:- start:538 stop:1515 length:978 start_codon:yes stop_codon:yes gene_type:complete
MAISVDTVYQRVLALANKEQRGYITPQEFNLFANQAQLEIFEQYFYDKNQFNRMPGENTPYADMNHIIEEKISIFKKRDQPITITSAFGDGTLPTDIYRLDNVTRFSLTNITGSTINTIEEVTEDEFVIYGRSPLTAATITRPIYVRTSETGIKIAPRNQDPSKSAAVYFIVGGFDINSGSSNVVVSVNSANYSFIEVGQEIKQAHIPPATFVGSVSNGTIGLVNANGVTVNATGSGDPVQVTFASDDVKCNYIKKPSTVSWGYTEINGTALYNSASSTDFELHPAEEPSLVYRILTLGGVSIADPNLYQIAAQEEMKITQQEKQ